ncbi:MAG: hypothetical protein WC933_03810 [Candidatus Paceibacterota bacterium]|jgi:hypothetical protein
MIKQIIRKRKQELRVESFYGTYAIQDLKEVQAYFRKYHIKARYRFRGSRHDKNRLTCLRHDAKSFDVYLRD